MSCGADPPNVKWALVAVCPPTTSDLIQLVGRLGRPSRAESAAYINASFKRYEYTKQRIRDSFKKGGYMSERNDRLCDADDLAQLIFSYRCRHAHIKRYSGFSTTYSCADKCDYCILASQRKTTGEPAALDSSIFVDTLRSIFRSKRNPETITQSFVSNFVLNKVRKEFSSKVEAGKADFQTEFRYL